MSRTFHLGVPSEREVDIYTRVLKGLVDLAMLRFPRGLPLRSVDVLARSHLWQAGEDFRHGTGHGVGVFGAIHECELQSQDSSCFEKTPIV